ncbi:glycoside hydrolase family 10 protein [Bacillus kwashiorkori]|uniref:glycoside hydrolase family 10 protein n=1 Tax=Bacillus kwashiorkori TaxID=1522318 RepID=UPI0007824F8E|nr:family 10 glycosylhydrolase [Bacillus kwashiorkori]
MRKSWVVLVIIALVSSLVPISSNNNHAFAQKPSIDQLTLVDQSGDTIKVDGINQLQNNNKLIMFNDQFSYYTETANGSSEVVLEKTGINKFKVTRKTNGDSPIPENGLVLSTGVQSTTDIMEFINQLKIGEVVTLLEPLVKEVQKKANAINPTRESNPEGAVFDGFRGPDQLIVYTPAFGETTKTNPYGYEITVENGFVTKLGGGNSTIPENGFVVSGHGVASNWISSNSIIGAKVIVENEGIVKIIQDVDSYQYQSQQAINQAKLSIEKASDEFLDVAFNKANESLRLAEKTLEDARNASDVDSLKSLDLTRQATQYAYDAYYYSLPSNKAEQRGIWYRPEEVSLDGIIQVLDRMEKAGFNAIYLETTFWGYTIYPSEVMKDYGLPEQHPRFVNAHYGKYGKDILKAYIKEGEKRGITVHAWTDGFMIGHSSLGLPSQFQKYPEWAAIQRLNTTGTPQPDTASQYYWLDIAQPEVQNFMLKIYEEMQRNYHIKGLNIDYMRYPHHNFHQSYGFSETIRNEYKKETGIDPYEINPEESPTEWEEWQLWIRQQENLFVDKLHEQSKKMNKKFMLTATPEPGPEAVLINDWKDDLDGVIPQAYGHDFNSIQKTVQDSKKLMPEGTMYYTGIYSFYHHLNEMAAVSDVISARYGTSGVNMFAFGQASAPSVDALGKGPWRETAVNPGEEPILATQTVLKEIEKQFNKIYLKQGAVEKNEGKILRKAIKDLQKEVRKNPRNSIEMVEDVIMKVEKYKLAEKLNEKVAERLKVQLTECKTWVQYSLNRQ